MKQPKKTYVGMAVFFERLADDGWPEDASGWPIGRCTLLPADCSDERVRGVKQLRRSPFIKSLLRIRIRT
jgi:hypothetical protein